jgi:hypothetical protein
MPTPPTPDVFTAAEPPDLAPALAEARTALMLAVRHGDPVGERVHRRRLAGWKLADALNQSQARGLVLKPDEARAWKHLIVLLCSGADPGHPTSGGDAVRRMHATTGVAEVGYPGDDPPDTTCDRCGAPDAMLSASMDLTGEATPATEITRLCAACRDAD